MAKNLIACSFASDENLQSSVNLKTNSNDARLIVYMKNVFVALVSAKQNNPNCDVGLITNVSVPADFLKLFQNFEIKVFNAAFDDFKFGPETKWGLAFYKICGLKKSLNFGYKNICLLDADTYTQNNFDDLWTWCENETLLLFDCSFRREKTQFWQDVDRFRGTNKPFTHFGGEFIAGSVETLTQHIKNCDNIYARMLTENLQTSQGDEFITSIAAERFNGKIKHAGGFIFRFWTRTYRRTTTTYDQGGVSILHVPGEKEFGMLKMFNYIVKHKKIPSQRKAQFILHIRIPAPLVCCAIFLNELKRIFGKYRSRQ